MIPRLTPRLTPQRGVLALVAGLLIVTAGVGSAGAQPFPVGSEVRINGNVPASQYTPAAALSPQGDLFAAWDSNFQDGEYGGIYGRRYSLADLGHPTPEMGVNQVRKGSQYNPEVVWLADGRFLVTWIADIAPPSARFYGRDGAPLGDEMPLALQSNIAFQTLALPAGGFLTLWQPEFGFGASIEGRIFGSDSGPAGPVLEIAADDGMNAFGAAVAPDGGFTVAWTADSTPSGQHLAFQRISSSGSALSSPVFLDPGGNSPCCARLALDPQGNLVLAWSLAQTVQTTIPRQVRRSFLQRFNPAGQALSPRTEVDPDDAGVDHTVDSVLADPAGNVVVAWREGQAFFNPPPSSGFGARIRFFGPDLSPRGATVQLNASLTGDHLPGTLATDGHGNLIATWSGPGADDPQGVYMRRFRLPCAPGPDRLCLQNGRFQVAVSWQNPFDGGAGTGHAVPLTDDTGAFWFFGESNLELMIKVLDGTAVNGNFWVYSGALSNVEYTITVTDAATGAERSYHNPAGQFASLADVEAFPSAAASTAGTAKTPGTVTAAGASLAVAGHFTVEVQFTDPRTGTAAQATAVPLTADTGAFWFFDPSNLELMVKVLDGRAVNGRFWVFFGALSDVGYTLTVTDTQTGQQRTYRNDPGSLASRADTAAF
jgi:hypothetical protein